MQSFKKIYLKFINGRVEEVNNPKVSRKKKTPLPLIKHKILFLFKVTIALVLTYFFFVNIFFFANSGNKKEIVNVNENNADFNVELKLEKENTLIKTEINEDDIDIDVDEKHNDTENIIADESSELNTVELFTLLFELDAIYSDIVRDEISLMNRHANGKLGSLSLESSLRRNEDRKRTIIDSLSKMNGTQATNSANSFISRIESNIANTPNRIISGEYMYVVDTIVEIENKNKIKQNEILLDELNSHQIPYEIQEDSKLIKLGVE